MANDTFEIVILEDGTLQITTRGFGRAIHKQADEFLEELIREAGGARQKRANPERARTQRHLHQHGG